MNTLPQVMTMPILEEEIDDSITVSWNPSTRSGVTYELIGDGDEDGIFTEIVTTTATTYTV